VRAGLTCIKMYLQIVSPTAPNNTNKATAAQSISSIESEYPSRLKLLESAKVYFEEALETLSKTGKDSTFNSNNLSSTSNLSGSSSSGNLSADGSGEFAQSPSSTKINSVLTEGEINKYLHTVQLQIEVTKYLAAHFKAISGYQLIQLHKISLFSTPKQKGEVAEYLLILGNFDLGFRIVQDFRLPHSLVTIQAATTLCRKKQSSKVDELLKNIKGTVGDEDWDSVVLSCISVLAQELDEHKSAEKLVAKLITTESKVKAHIMCGKLKAAYLMAVKENSLLLVKEVRDHARRAAIIAAGGNLPSSSSPFVDPNKSGSLSAGNTTAHIVYALCEKYIAKLEESPG